MPDSNEVQTENGSDELLAQTIERHLETPGGEPLSVILFSGGQIIAGEVATIGDVGALAGDLEVVEADGSRHPIADVREPGTDVITLINVKLLSLDRSQLPFIRVRRDRVDAWTIGALA